MPDGWTQDDEIAVYIDATYSTARFRLAEWTRTRSVGCDKEYCPNKINEGDEYVNFFLETDRGEFDVNFCLKCGAKEAAEQAEELAKIFLEAVQ